MLCLGHVNVDLTSEYHTKSVKNTKKCVLYGDHTYYSHWPIGLGLKVKSKVI